MLKGLECWGWGDFRLLGMDFSLRSLDPCLLSMAADGCVGRSVEKVRAVKSGAELRVSQKNAKTLLLGRFDEATAENLIIVVKDS